METPSQKRYKEYGKAYYQRNKERICEKAKRNYSENPGKYIRTGRARYNNPKYYTQIIHERCRLRARQQGIPFNIEVKDIIIPDNCPIFGFPLERNWGGKAKYNSPSVDKINPFLGYTKGNIQIISYKANIMKSNATKTELEAFANWILSRTQTPAI